MVNPYGATCPLARLLGRSWWLSAWRAGALRAICVAALCGCFLSMAHAQQVTPRPSAGGQACLRDSELTGVLSANLVSIAPVGLCDPSYYIVELRNNSAVALGDAALSIVAPIGPDRMVIERLFDGASETFFEISVDDGATWRPAQLPIGSGAADAPMSWSTDELAALARLGPAGSTDDSVLLRWRAVLGDAYGSEVAPDALLIMSARAVDACGRATEMRSEPTILSVRRPELRARLEGRNKSWGGDFGAVAHAGPGDDVEWRIALENVGEALAHEARIRVTSGSAAPPQLSYPGASDRLSASSGVARLRSVAPGGRQVAILQERIGQICAPQRRRAAPSWGCAEPPMDQDAAIAPPTAFGEAQLITAIDPSAVLVEPRMIDPSGAEHPGDEAEVRVMIENGGAPLASPVLAVRLPDGYVFDERGSARLLKKGIRAARLRVDGSNPDEPRFLMLDRDGASGGLGPQEQIEISFRAYRARAGVIKDNEIAAALSFSDGCGATFESRLGRAAVTPRQAALQLSLTPLDPPVVSGDGAVRRFRAEIRNVGNETARAIQVAVTLGEAWAASRRSQCAPTSDAGAERRFICSLGRDIEPGARATRELSFTVGQKLGEPGASLSIKAEAQALGHRGGASVLARASAETAVIGFELRQRLLDDDGVELDPNAPIDLGALVWLEVEGRWFGLDGLAIEDAAIAQTLPPDLGFQATRADGENIELADVLTPLAGASGQLLWSLKPFKGDGRFTGRARLEVIERAGSALAQTERARRTAVETRAAVDANAIFRTAFGSFGVDALALGSTVAAPLNLSFRRPNITLSFGVKEREPIGDRTWLVRGGERVVVELELANRGAAPGYLDWARLRIDRLLSLADPATDGVDNDDDGETDEADETNRNFTRRPVGDSGVELQWGGLPGQDPNALTDAAARIAPDAVYRWRLAFDVDENAAPAQEVAVALDGQFGARPFAEELENARQRLHGDVALRTPAPGGFLVLTDSSYGDDLRGAVADGERVEFRMTLHMPPGWVRDATVTLRTPPALRDLVASAARIGSGVQCAQIGAPIDTVADDETGGATLQWRLGDCLGALDGDKASRALILDFSSAVEDADPRLSEITIRHWRRPEISATLSYRVEGEARQIEIGRRGLRISGPLVAGSLVGPGGGGDGGALDAGDRFERRLELTNVGDGPAQGLRLTFDVASGAGLDCDSVDVVFRDPQSGADASRLARAGVKTCDLRFAENTFRLEPKASAQLIVRGRLHPAETLLGRDVAVPLKVGIGAEIGAKRYAGRAAPIMLSFDVAAPKAPEVMITRGSEARSAETGMMTIGDQLRLRGEFEIPEGAGAVRLGLRVQFLRKGGAAAAREETPGVRLLHARLSRDRDDIRASDIDQLAAVAPGAPFDVSGLVELRPLEIGGWETILDLGDIQFASPRPGPGSGRLIFEADFEIADSAEVRAGREVQGVAALYLTHMELGRQRDREDAFAEGEIVSAAAQAGRIAEPTLELAVVSTDRDGVSGPGDRVAFEAIACNRGDAAAYGVVMVGELRAGLRIDQRAALSYAYDAGSGGGDARLRRRPYGEARRRGARVIGAPASSSAELAPGHCVVLSTPVIVEATSREGLAQAAFRIERYQGRPSPSAPGRIYQGGEAVGAVSLYRLRIEPRGPLMADQDQARVIPFSVRATLQAAPARLQLAADTPGHVRVRFFRDLNVNGELDVGDAPWRDGETLALDRATPLLAQFLRFGEAAAPWPATVRLRAFGVTETNESLRGAVTFSLGLGGESAPIRARRVMAVDRNCDGFLSDESAQDATFETSKEAAPGECVVMRVRFRNAGAAAVERVFVEDRIPDGVRYVPGSAKFTQIPHGLIGAELLEPAADGLSITFRFLGALSPGINGMVEYRVRLSEDG